MKILIVVIFFSLSCTNLFEFSSASKNTASTISITHPLNPAGYGDKTPITENEAKLLVEQYRSQLHEIKVGMQYYTYEKNQFYGSPPSTPDLQCEDFIVYKKTVTKINDTKIHVFIQRDAATNQDCPATIILNNCIEILENEFEWPQTQLGAQIKFYETSVNNEKAILMEANYTDPEYAQAIVKFEAVSVLSRPHLISTYIDLAYFLVEGQIQTNIVNNLFFTSEQYNMINIDTINSNEAPLCGF